MSSRDLGRRTKGKKKKKEQINNECAEQKALNLFFSPPYNYLIVYLAPALRSARWGDFGDFYTRLAKVCLHFPVAVFLTDEWKSFVNTVFQH